MLRKKAKTNVRASITVEAAFIMSVVLLCLALLIRFGFQVHDQVVGNAVLNEGLELLSHTEDPDTEEIAQRGTRRMQNALSGKGFQIRYSVYRDGFQGTGGGSRYQREMTDKGFHPETFLRKITLLEGIND